MDKRSETPTAEDLLAADGVFAGHHGLREFAAADAFWEQQPYGTRLYYGDGGSQYLHRGVLQTAVQLLDKYAALSRQPEAVRDAALDISSRPDGWRLYCEAFRALFGDKKVELSAAALDEMADRALNGQREEGRG